MQLYKLSSTIAFCLITNLVLAKAPIFTEKDYFNHPPRIIRTCCAFGTDLKVSIIPGYRYTMLTSTELLGSHQYLGDKAEHNGILYTRRGGFIDFGHLRDLVDWTAYLYNLAKKSQSSGEIVIHLGFESGEKILQIKVPSSEKEEDLILLASRIAYDLSIWHEITSWFGASAVPLVSERFSSFSIEDAYSNLLGTKIAAEAIQSEHPYNEAVTEAIKQTLVDLEPVKSKDETYQAMEAVRDLWWTRKKHLPNNHVMMQRELGVYSGLTPWLVPGWESTNKSTFNIVLPETTQNGIPLTDYYTLTFSVNRKIPVSKIFPHRNLRVVTQQDFKGIIEYISTCMIKNKILFRY